MDLMRICSEVLAQLLFFSDRVFQLGSQPRDNFTCNKVFNSALGSEGPGHAGLFKGPETATSVVSLG